ncbi:MAG TPA: glycosyltransferase [Tepidisphaeraceae bacterium]|jgi:glycosyltransferase involved in cell wall biosynthesis
MTIGRPVRLLAFPCDNFACGHWRVIQPLAAMKDPRVSAVSVVDTQIVLDSFDVALFQRVLWPEQLAPIRTLKSVGKKIIIDYDDAFPMTDPSHSEYATFAPGTPNAAALEEGLRLADAIIVPTRELLSHYQKMHSRVILVPNAVDLDGPLYAAGAMERLSPAPTIYWSGWTSHAKNLRAIEPAITWLLACRDDVVFALCGPPEFGEIFSAARASGKLILLPRVPYEQFLTIASAVDISIAPLELTSFNQFKSEIRIIEAGAWGVPTVASPAAPYQRFEGGRGACCLVEGNDLQSWHRELSKLLDDPGLRSQVGAEARAVVRSQYALADANAARVELLLDL